MLSNYGRSMKEQKKELLKELLQIYKCHISKNSKLRYALTWEELIPIVLIVPLTALSLLKTKNSCLLQMKMQCFYGVYRKILNLLYFDNCKVNKKVNIKIKSHVLKLIPLLNIFSLMALIKVNLVLLIQDYP